MPNDLSARLRSFVEACELTNYDRSVVVLALADAANTIDQQAAELAGYKNDLVTWPLGTRVRKRSGSSWQGRIVGFYATSLTPVGYCVESEREPGSVQIYPEAALEVVHD